MTRKPALAGVAIIASLAFLSACRNGVRETHQAGKSDSAASRTRSLHQCPMHPQILQDHPGACPLCGMALVMVPEEKEMERDKHRAAESGSGSSDRIIRIRPEMVQNIGVRMEAVRRRGLAGEIRVAGRIMADESRIRSVTSRFAGYIETLPAGVSGQYVRAGDTLLEVFSQDLIVAQNRYLEIIRLYNAVPADPNAEAAKSNLSVSLRMTRTTLEDYDLPRSFLDGLRETGRGVRRFPVVAPISGAILRKNVLQGQSIMPGTEMFRIADLSRVWVVARIYQSDMASIRIGAGARLAFANLPGREFAATVFFIAPEMDPATRSIEIRMRLANTPARDFLPEMAVDVTLSGKSDSVLAVPDQALIRSGSRVIAIVALGEGRFEPRQVRLGRGANGMVEVLDGLAEGENLVVSAQFLIDSESNLRAAVEMMRSRENGKAGGPAGAASGGMAHAP